MACVTLQQIAHINKELSVQWVDSATPQFNRIEGFEAIYDRLVQAKPHPQHLNGFLLQARVTNPGPCRVTGQDAEQKEIKDDNKQDGKKRPGYFFE